MPAPDAPRPLLNARIFGALLRILRQDSGYERGQSFCDEVFLRTNVVLSERTLYAIEKGAQAPRFAEVIAFTVVLKPDHGIHYFSAAMDPGNAAIFQRLNCPPRAVPAAPDATQQP
jgi:hypothetical protein